MTDGIALKPGPGGGGRPKRVGRVLRSARRVGCRNKTTIAAASLLAAEALTRKGVELALAGGPITPGEAVTIARCWRLIST